MNICFRVVTCCREALRKHLGLEAKSGVEYLDATLDSILRSDIPQDDLEVHHNHLIGESDSYVRTLRQLGERAYSRQWPGAYEAYSNALHQPFEGEWLVLFEDDITVDRNIRAKVDAFITDNPELKLATLFDQLTIGREHKSIPSGHWWGTQAMLFHRSVIERIPKTWNVFIKRFPEMEAVLPYPVWDAVISLTCGESKVFIHKPSLVEHIGYVSSWNDVPVRPTSFRQQLTA